MAKETRRRASAACDPSAYALMEARLDAAVFIADGDGGGLIICMHRKGQIFQDA